MKRSNVHDVEKLTESILASYKTDERTQRIGQSALPSREKIVEIVTPSFEDNGTPVMMAPAIGISFFPLNAQSAQGLVRDAMIAMDRAIGDGASLRFA